MQYNKVVSSPHPTAHTKEVIDPSRMVAIAMHSGTSLMHKVRVLPAHKHIQEGNIPNDVINRI